MQDAPKSPQAPIVCCVTDGKKFPPRDRHQHTVESIRRAIDGGVDWIQLREKDLPSRALLALTRAVVEIAASNSAVTQIIVNDRLDVALAARAAGAHLGGESLSADTVNQWLRSRALGANFQVGVSCHSLEEARAAESAGATYVFFGPVFDTPSKRIFGEPQGAEKLAVVCGAVRIPVVAIGGVNEENARECLNAGAAGIAAIRLFQEQRDPGALAELISCLHATR